MNAHIYQQNRVKLLRHLEELQETYNDLSFAYPSFFSELPSETSRRLQFIEKDIKRLRKADLEIAFVGGFSAGKSSLLNAFLGHYLLPESTEITTAVPTYVKCNPNLRTLFAEVHYLSPDQIDELEKMYRREISEALGNTKLENARFEQIIAEVRAATTNAKAKRLADSMEMLNREKPKYVNGSIRSSELTIKQMQELVRNEKEGIFIDHVEVNIPSDQVPSDVVLVDLPGLSVPNPRHRATTKRFVSNAHAIIFVLVANRLFDNDETEVMDEISKGENRLADKTFWVLNRWDALRSSFEQQESTISNFKNTLEQYKITNPKYFKTNALYGLLAQLVLLSEVPEDPKLLKHLSAYNEVPRSAEEHRVILTQSEIPKLKEEVLAFLNQGIRKTTLEIARENTEQYFCQPILHHLRLKRQSDDVFLEQELKKNERAKIKALTQEQIDLRLNDLGSIINRVLDKVVVERAALFADQEKQLEKELRREIKSGETTDAWQVYKEIMRENKFRKYPYYFEIEIHVIDNLNTILKNHFLKIAKSQVGEVAKELVADIRNFLEKLNADVSYDISVAESFEKLLVEFDRTVQETVENIVSERAPLLDELLVHSPGSFFRLRRSNNAIVDGLEKAARMHNRQLIDTHQPVHQKDMDARTRQIRSTLENHYIDKTLVFRAEVADSIWPIIKNQILELKEHLKGVIDKKYEPIVAKLKEQQVASEFSSQRASIENRIIRFREAVAKVEGTSREMRLLNFEVL